MWSRLRTGNVIHRTPEREIRFFDPLGNGLPAGPRPGHRLRGDATLPTAMLDGVLVAFDDPPVPPGTPASPRPADRPRELPGARPDVATELAVRTLEFVRANPSATVEELAALMGQLLARRSA